MHLDPQSDDVQIRLAAQPWEMEPLGDRLARHLDPPANGGEAGERGTSAAVLGQQRHTGQAVGDRLEGVAGPQRVSPSHAFGLDGQSSTGMRLAGEHPPWKDRVPAEWLLVAEMGTPYDQPGMPATHLQVTPTLVRHSYWQPPREGARSDVH
jgi:hypothetical protein